MTVATALIAGNDPLPQLAEQAVAQALAHAGLTQANGVLLFLTPEFARHAQAAVTAAARAASCTQVAGAIVAGVFTESDWVLDRPAAAAMVLGGNLALSSAPHPPLLAFAGCHTPAEWLEGAPRFGGSFTGSVSYAEPVAWQSARLNEAKNFCTSLSGARIAIAVSSGLSPLGKSFTVENVSGYELHTIGKYAALQHLSLNLPPALRNISPLPLHHLGALLLDGESAHPVALLSANRDGSLTLSERLTAGQHLVWAQRDPAGTEADMRMQIDALKAETPMPDCALAFSCIGRGPYFYGGEDRDRSALIERFPGLPLLGCYGTGQLAPTATGKTGNRLMQNAVVTALITAQPRVAHVQSIT